MTKTSSGLSLAVLRQRDSSTPIPQPLFIAALDRAIAALKESTDVEELIETRDWAFAAEAYAHAVNLGDEAERYARETRVRAARRAGELLRQMKEDRQRFGQGRTSEVTRGNFTPPTLEDLGIRRNLASVWQRMALVDDEVFETAVKNGEAEKTIARRAPDRPRKLRPVEKETGKRKGPTERQSLQGLQQAAIALQALAENLDGELFGDWSLLADVEEAQQWFDILAESLPVVRSRILRALRDRRGRGHGH